MVIEVLALVEATLSEIFVSAPVFVVEASSFRLGHSRHVAPKVGAWLNFYVLSQTVSEARRLLSVYQRRLRSNLLVCLRPLVGARAEMVAAGLGALIDGVYLREALKEGPPDSASAVATVMDFVAAELGNRT